VGLQMTDAVFKAKLTVSSGHGQQTRRKAWPVVFLRHLVLACSLLSVASLCSAAKVGAQTAGANYVCPMHPEVRSKSPGKCPKCGMALKEQRTQTAAPPAGARAAAGRTAADAVEQTGPDATSSMHIPDATVYDQNGRRLHFFTDLVKGKTVAINFIFTTCTTICPPLMANFRKVQQDLGDRVGREVALISISVDPTTDVPERLGSFAAKFNVRNGWTLVTGQQPEITALLQSLGAAVADKNDHTPLILVGNEASGSWTRVNGLAPSATILKAINDAAPQISVKSNPETPPPGDAAKAPSPSDAAAHYFPNSVLLTQDNKAVRFFDDLLKGKTVLINFFFATCTGVCSPMTANLAKVRAILGERVGREINMISITVDPVIDTPESLKQYADRFNITPGWYFLTGKKENVDWVLYKLGGYVEEKTDHTNLLIIGNVETGELVKVFAMGNPAQIAEAAMKVANLAPPQAPRQGQR